MGFSVKLFYLKGYLIFLWNRGTASIGGCVCRLKIKHLLHFYSYFPCGVTLLQSCYKGQLKCKEGVGVE